jgi:hypothetical protein
VYFIVLKLVEHTSLVSPHQWCNRYRTRHIITQSLWLLCGEVANINFMIFGFIRPLLARTIQRIRDGYDNHYTTDVDLQEKYVQLV